MKKLIFLVTVFCIFFKILPAQNEPVLLQEFSAESQVFFVNIDHDDPKILLKRLDGFDLYNLDYTLFTVVQYPAAIDTIDQKFLYLVTRSLFDCDSTQLEYLISGYTGGSGFVRIYGEDGTEFFSLDEYAFMNIGVLNTDPLTHYVTTNEEGSYIIFSNTFLETGNHRLYQLCGQVPKMSVPCMDGTALFTSPVTKQKGFGVYPNPGKDYIRLEYDLQDQNYATVTLFNLYGQVVKEVKIGKAFDFIHLDISDLAQGNYIARIITEDGHELAEKFVKVE